MYSGIIPIIKKAALDAVESTQPVNIVFGTVTSASPLKIQITPKLVLKSGNLVVAARLSKQTATGSTGGVTFDNSLKNGDSVILVRIQGGNKYLVLDKVVNA